MNSKMKALKDSWRVYWRREKRAKKEVLKNFLKGYASMSPVCQNVDLRGRGSRLGIPAGSGLFPDNAKPYKEKTLDAMLDGMKCGVTAVISNRHIMELRRR
ncbi:unnamed protein product [Haemonchus placei]|uniref:PGM_PMM_I domain-containing protein n=1 Tax=Haemonchus placei TaxID=6290 RepID=A0A0N4VX88_HAEPC|nr:unnamed protein product [Haemonchus placei]